MGRNKPGNKARSANARDARARKLVIELEFDGDASIAYDAVSNVLDSGTLQDAIREYADDNGHEVSVTSAVLK